MAEARLSPDACEAPFWEQPSILFDSFSLFYERRCSHSLWNFVARIVILSFFVGLIGSSMAGLGFLPVSLLFGGLTAFALTMLPSFSSTPVSSAGYEKVPLYKVVDPSDQLSSSPIVHPEPTGYLAPMKEAFVNGGALQGSVQPIEDPIGAHEIDAAPYSGPALPDHTPPTSRNPFMNILLDEIKYNPNRPPAASVQDPAVSQVMDDYFRIQWHSDPTDVFGKKQSQRQFITQPSTTIPNDQGSFANWLYRIPGKTCKEGGRDACLKMLHIGNIPWMDQF